MQAKRSLLLGSFIAIAIAFSSTSADAKPKISIDGEGAIALQPTSVASGFGGGLRLGYEFDAVLISLTPEIGGDFHTFGAVQAPDVLRGFGGARLAIGAIVRPNVYFHVGYASVNNRTAPDRSGVSYDGGVGLDLTVIPVIDIGVHLTYAVVPGTADGPSNQWLAPGVHVAAVF